MKPNRVPDDLIEAGFDAIRAWYAAHPGPNSYLDNRTQMRIVLAAVLTVHNERVEQPPRERAETAECELADLRARHDVMGRTRAEIAHELRDARRWYPDNAYWTQDMAQAARIVEIGLDRYAEENRLPRLGGFVREPRIVGQWEAAEQQLRGNTGGPA